MTVDNAWKCTNFSHKGPHQIAKILLYPRFFFLSEKSYVLGLQLDPLSLKNMVRSWRKLLKVRDMARNFLKFEVGDGKSIHLWMDWWHPDGILYEQNMYDDQI